MVMRLRSNLKGVLLPPSQKSSRGPEFESCQKSSRLLTIDWMDIQYTSLENCAQAAGTVVVIDVLRAGQLFSNPALPDFPAADLDYCLVVNRFNFAMPVRREGGLWLMIPAHAPGS